MREACVQLGMSYKLNNTRVVN